MSDREGTGRRSAAYSVWHRPESINRILQNPDLARSLGMIDIDNIIWVEWEKGTNRPLALIETAEDTPYNRSRKCVNVLKALALKADLPAFLVLVTEASTLNPADETKTVRDISRFAMRRIDIPKPAHGFIERTPDEYVQWLIQLRQHQTRALVRNPPLPFESDAEERA